MNIEKIYDSGEAAILGTVSIGGSIWATADGVLAVADYWHYLMDANKLFGASTGILNGSAANGAIDNLMVLTKNMTIRIMVRGSSDFTFYMLEAPSISGSGTQVSGVSFDRTRAPAAVGATFYHSSALSATGTTIYKKFIPSGEGRFGGGQALAGEDWKLCAGTLYGFRILPHQVGTFNISGEFYFD